MNQQCLDRRIDSMDLLESELAAWETRRDRERANINWMFDVDKAAVVYGRSGEGDYIRACNFGMTVSERRGGSKRCKK